MENPSIYAEKVKTNLKPSFNLVNFPLVSSLTGGFLKVSKIFSKWAEIQKILLHKINHLILILILYFLRFGIRFLKLKSSNKIRADKK